MAGSNLARALVLGLCLLSSAASAADMAVKARPLPQPFFSWTGFYAGLNVGYGTSRSSSFNDPVDPVSQFLFTARFAPTDFTSAFRQSGVIAGGQAGYNLQFSERFVAGLEADFQYSDVRARNFSQAFIDADPTAGFNVFAERRLKWFGTVRGRLGVLVTPDLLLYGTGGLAYGETLTSGDIIFAPTVPGTVQNQVNGVSFRCGPVSPVTCYTGSNNQTDFGWTAGAGGELRIGGNWTAKLEYLHVDLPGTSVTLISPPPSSAGVSTIFRFNHQSYDFVRIGMNYKFGGPIVAGY